MTNDKALEVLIKHQDWRLGAEIDMQDPKEITAAINVAIEVLTNNKKTKL